MVSYSALVSFQSALSMWQGYDWVFAFAHGACKRVREISHPSGLPLGIFIVSRAEKLCSSLRARVSYQIQVFRHRRIVAIGCGLWLWKNAGKSHVLSSRLSERASLGKSSGWEYLCLSINSFHLLGMWQKETNTGQLLCDFFSQRGHLRLPQSQSSDVSNNTFAK